MVPFPRDLIPHIEKYREMTGMTTGDAVSRLALIGDLMQNEFEAFMEEGKTGKCLYPEQHGDAIKHKVVFEWFKMFYESVKDEQEFWAVRTNYRFSMNAHEHARYKAAADRAAGHDLGDVISLRVYIGLLLLRRCALIDREIDVLANADCQDDEIFEVAKKSSMFCGYAEANILDVANTRKIDYWVQVEKDYLNEVKKKEYEFALDNKELAVLVGAVDRKRDTIPPWRSVSL